MQDHKKAVLYAIAACALWGTVYVAIKAGLNHGLRPLSFAGVRFLIGGLILMAAAGARGRLAFSRSEFRKFALLGLFQTGLQNALFFTGVKLTSAGTAAIFINTQPFFVILLAPLFFKFSRITPLRLIGVSIGFLGVALAVSGPGEVPEGYAPGIAALVGAGLTWACSSIAAKMLMAGKDAMAVTAAQMTMGALPLLLVGIAVEGNPLAGVDTTGLAMLGYLAVFATSIPFFAWYKALGYGEVGRVAVFSFTLPVLGVISGWLLLDEPLGPYIFAGMTLVAAGIIIVNTAGTAYFKNLRRPSL